MNSFEPTARSDGRGNTVFSVICIPFDIGCPMMSVGITLNFKAKIINYNPPLRSLGFEPLCAKSNGMFEQDDLKDSYFDISIFHVKSVLPPLEGEL